MNGSGFEWLNVPPNQNQTHSADISRTGSPTPAVSFGAVGNSDSSLANRNYPQNYRFNTSADDILNHRTEQLDDKVDEESIPLSLTTHELTLSESRTYIRWYSDILARTNSRTISMTDIFHFLVNFKLSQQLKDQLNRLYSKTIHSINVGEFFALLRLISHCLNGQEFSRRLIKVNAPVPTPPSILSKKRQSSDEEDEESDIPEPETDTANEESKRMDLDGFTRFMLTGQRPDETPDEKPYKRKKKLKSVKFSDQIVTGVHETNGASPLPSSPPNELDYSLPMDQLLSRIGTQSTGGAGYTKPDDEEQQILQDMGSQLNHFQNLHSVDTASIGGVPSSIHLSNSVNASNEQLLKPNMTGPAQMSQYLQSQPQNQGQDSTEEDKYRQLKPNRTGPYDMARMFTPPTQTTAAERQSVSPVPGFIQDQETPKISLQSFTDQMTGNTAVNTMANSRIDNASPSFERPLPPPPAPASRRTRSLSSPTPPPPPNSRLSPNGRQPPPPPPPSRRRGASATYASPTPEAPPSLPPKIPEYSSQFNGQAQLQAPNPQQFMPDQFNQFMPENQFNSQQFMPAPNEVPQNQIYSNTTGGSNGSTTDILDDLKQLQAEVDRIRDMTGGF